MLIINDFGVENDLNFLPRWGGHFGIGLSIGYRYPHFTKTQPYNEYMQVSDIVSDGTSKIIENRSYLKIIFGHKKWHGSDESRSRAERIHNPAARDLDI
jgi:hypothetical protein